MKSISNIAQLVKPLNSRSGASDIPSYRDVIVDCLGQSITAGDLSVSICKLIEKFRGEDTVELEDDEFETVKKCVTENYGKYFAWVHGQVMLKMKEWEEANGQHRIEE